MPQDFFENVGSSLKVLRKEIAAISELDNIKRDIDEVIENINSPLLVMVMGEFSRGKSTFINALVGQSIAMVDAKPTTAVITKLSYGEKDKITVFMRDGSVKNYDTDSFARLTAQGNDKSNKLHKKIDYVERTLPIDMLKSMSIIDSPGLNSINDVHEAATKRFMDKADTVIWLFDANDPCKQTEIDALKRLNPRLAPLVLVNKIDVIDEDEGDTPEKVLAKIERDLSNNKLEYQKIIGISAKMAFKGKVNNNQKLITASNINEFYDAVDTIILPNREKFKRISMVDELARVFFSAGRILNGKREENNNRKNADYSAYIGTEESLACALDELENAADIVMTEIDSEQTARRKRLNPAEKTFYGALYWHGLLEKKDRKTAQKYTEEAAVRGDAVAQMNLAEMYQELGQEDRAEYWFQRLGKTRKVGENAESAYSKAEKYAKDGKYTEAVTWDCKAAEAGNADAMANRGYVYDYGVGVEKDKAEALKWYKEAIKAGCNDATVKKRIKDIEAAQASASGVQNTYRAESTNKNSSLSAEEMYRKAEQYYQRHSFAEAVKWYRKAAEVGNADAMASLGYAYDYGVGVEKDKAEALKRYKEAIKAGCNDATVKKRIKEIESAQSSASGFQNIYQAESTNKNSSLSAEEMYRKAEQYYQRHSFAEAVKWYRKAAEAGNADAMYHLGYAYEYGSGVKKDKIEAEKWYKKAAGAGSEFAKRRIKGIELEIYSKATEAGNADAMANRGYVYDYGVGVEKDKAEALKWYKEAIKAGCNDATVKKRIKEIESAQSSASGFQNIYQAESTNKNSSLSAEEMYRKAEQYYQMHSFAEAVKWYRRAAEAGNKYAMYDLGYAYEIGRGVKKDENEAVKWYKKSAGAGYRKAKQRIEVVEKKNRKISDVEKKNRIISDVEKMYQKGKYHYDLGKKHGIGNFTEARVCFEKAAEAGHIAAMYYLGDMYARGLEGFKNLEIASNWLSKAAASGYLGAQERLDEVKKEKEQRKQEIEKRKREQEIEKRPREQESGFCFITTAVCNSFQKTDDCYELTMFRCFRDGWLKAQPDGAKLIKEYYEVAPSIVKAIDGENRANEIYHSIWTEYLSPCLKMLEDGCNEECKAMYMRMVLVLKKKYIH
ncbi:dynamin family protein [Schwartzia succinivorans]|uniref:dynamin family protein n=1 Tax=Schwartzia succinivorans TaxID=55507 RepID=UPI000932C769|nr:dynamin family protein [Schwartzia succinivorans]